MKEGVDKRKDVFTNHLWETSERYRNMIAGDLASVKRTFQDFTKTNSSASSLSGIELARKSLALEQALMYLKDGIQPVAAMHQDFKITKKQIDKAKRLLIRTTFSTPDDLSRFYKTLREDDDMLFGDIAAKAVKDMYISQPPQSHSLVSQIIYLQAMSRELFPEVIKRRNPSYRLNSEANVAADKSESKPTKLTRMLQEDFDLLTTMQVTGDYVRMAQQQRTASGINFTTGSQKVFAVLPEFQQPVQKSGVARELEALKAYSDYLSDDSKYSSKDAHSDQFKKEIDQLDIRYVQLWVNAHEMIALRKDGVYQKENTDVISAMPDVEWKSIQFSKEVPSGQKVFFEKKNSPLLVCVDPAPSKAYVASIGMMPLPLFQQIEVEKGSAQAARGMVNILKDPFTLRGFLDALRASAFYIRKSDGELCMYGDSTELARAQLGAHYDVTKKLVHNIIFSLTHSEYVPGEDTVPPENVGPKNEREFPLELIHPIPDEPTLRELPAQPEIETHHGRAFLGRSAHTRLLPNGWLPGFEAWEEARTATETIDLYAIVVDEQNIPRESIRLELKDDFKDFRIQLIGLRAQYQEKIRFQTYVKEV